MCVYILLLYIYIYIPLFSMIFLTKPSVNSVVVYTPEKLTNVPKKRDHYKRKFHLQTINVSGDMLVLR